MTRPVRARPAAGGRAGPASSAATRSSAPGALLMLLIILPGLCFAQTRPVEPGRLENQPLRGARVDAPLPTPGPSVPAAPAFDLKQVVLALSAVIGLILLLRWGGRRLFGGAVAATPTRAVQVLSRSVVSPRQQVLLLRVGRRVLVVADSGSGMRSLAEIRDPDEIAELVGQMRQDKGDSVVRGFASLFGKQRQKYDVDLPEVSAASAGPLPDEAPSLTEDAPPSTEDPSVGVTRQEIHGLMDKVKLLSRQFQR